MTKTTVGSRLIPAALLLALSFWLLISHSGMGVFAAPRVIMGMAAMVLSATIIAPSIAQALVQKAFDFFTYSEKFEQAPPMYGIPQAHRKNHRFEEAIKAYEKIAEDYPDEIRPYLEMIDIALSDLKDSQRAESIYQEGVIKFQGEDDRKRLARCLSGLRLVG